MQAEAAVMTGYCGEGKDFALRAWRRAATERKKSTAVFVHIACNYCNANKRRSRINRLPVIERRKHNCRSQFLH